MEDFELEYVIFLFIFVAKRIFVSKKIIVNN